jgi:hypothetical protein
VIRVNGVPLDNPDLGWIFRPRSVPYSNLEAELGQLSVSGWDGTVATSTTIHAPLYPLQVNTPPSGWGSLLALFGAQKLILTRDDQPTWEVAARFASSSVDTVYPRNEWIDATFIVELTGAFWRDKLASTVSAPLSGPSVPVNVFPGMSAPVADALIRVKGAATGVQVTDASGAWVTLPDTTAGQYARFESDTGKCFITTTAAWSGGTDVSGAVDFGGPRGVFEITPVLAAGNPSSRKGVLTVASASQSGAVVDVRGKGAYVL